MTDWLQKRSSNARRWGGALLALCCIALILFLGSIALDTIRAFLRTCLSVFPYSV